ncbi:hypothetical protein Curi_c05600 [Gottschalkia acidurici 9a]|uniref:Prolow-density lipoprotein receptor-related protein 1-like beta-propeller domain-containing protein n=1 Tax=Gottschalkia acidurici (strain ATCC 7906 / DSM 604 / BCRC 14475 / CIP 104303 / KCTC 5404 / NCIMB 10678 / 9a) TaxID=1128398 RepID=K0AWM0_GOTA9|nr:DUF5050 domain-containing protein [Gottschalkia acidurici]AFS77634.1 hypothetical protein Curi_c05600 [Gottschalkia acidurici 9a]
MSIIVTICAILILPTEKSFAKEQTVKTTLPNFTVTLNGNKVNNQYRQFPLLVYKDITYFPMTWFDSRLLGIETEWSQTNGLKIEQKKITSSFEDYSTKLKNANTQYAKTLDFKITLNGKLINNSNEEYPLLSFRDVTYFPLTWKFAHNEFNWKYDWSNSKGLSINSNNKQLMTINLPKYAGENSVAMYDGYYYFVETVDHTNNIYRVHGSNTTKKELVYSYEIDPHYGFQNLLKFEIKNGELWFSYHYGGAVMGSDIFCKINNDGKATEEYRGHINFIEVIPEGTLALSQPPTAQGSMLIYIPKGKNYEEGKRIGDTGLLYRSKISLQGDNVYVLGAKYPFEGEKVHKIYKVNINTNETLQITDFGVESLKVINNKLYYVKSIDKHLYSSNLDGTSEKKLSDNSLPEYDAWYEELNGNVYYATSNEENKQSIYKVEMDKEDSLLLKEKVDRVEILSGKLIAKLVSGEDYGIKIFDENGQMVLTVTDEVSDFFAHKDNILMILAKNKSVKLIK